MSISGVKLWASTAASIASFHSSTVMSSGTSWPLLEYSRNAFPTLVRVSMDRKTSPHGQWKNRGIVQSVLPWVPLPLPGAPNKMNVRYFMKATGYTALAANREGKRLFRSDRIDVDPSSTAIEADVAVDQSENRVIAAEPDIFTRQKFRAALANDDVAGHDQLAAESFYTETFANAVAAILNAALSFFMSHDLRFFRF